MENNIKKEIETKAIELFNSGLIDFHLIREKIQNDYIDNEIYLTNDEIYFVIVDILNTEIIKTDV